jgi:hypothetical protein
MTSTAISDNDNILDYNILDRICTIFLTEFARDRAPVEENVNQLLNTTYNN